MEKKVSDMIADFLEAKNIRYVFGIIGSGNANIFDAIAKKGFTEIICTHHEQAAVMAMIVYYRITGQVGATLLTTGAGSSNAITGVLNAWMDSMPGLIISGNENSKFTTAANPLRGWGIQGYDSSKTVENMTKYADRVMDPTQITYMLERAYYVSTHARPGPCWIDVPMNVQGMKVDPDLLPAFDPEVDEMVAHNVLRAPEGSPQIQYELAASIQTLLSLLAESKRPVLWLGNGIRLAGGDESLVLKLVTALGVPTLVSWAGIDLLDSHHALNVGRAGVYGQRAANLVLQNADLVITIGTRLAMPQVGYDITELAREAKLLMVDIDPHELMKLGNRVAAPVCADAKQFIEALLADLPAEGPTRGDWIVQCNLYKTKLPWLDRFHEDQDGFINSYRFMDKLNAYLKPDQIIVTDMGTALLSGHQMLKISAGQRLLTSTGLGEMGFGLPAAIGASIARERGEVLCLNCDGGMMMNLQELQTMAHHQLPIKLFIFNNDGYLMIKHTQKALYEGRYAGVHKKSGVSCPDFSKLAQAFGFPAYQIRTWEDVESMLPAIQQHNGPVICEVFMHPQQPLIPKLGLVSKKEGMIVSPPLEDLSPLLPRQEMKDHMIIGLHAKSMELES